MTVGNTIRFYFDYVSPNAYIAWTQLGELAGKYRCTVKPVPVLFAGLLNAYDQMGPAEIPAKYAWMAANMLRKTQQLGVPFNPPVFHPFNPLLALRVSSLDTPPATRDALVGALFSAVWVDAQDVTDNATVARIATAAGLDGAEAVRRGNDTEAKQRVRQQTDAAIAAGVFGVPTMIVGEELFWGYDDFAYLELYLQSKDPIDSVRHTLQDWQQVRASAVRKKD
ncbi:MAG: 2-hydroxychromene-2-carboxylate isomerase [Gammaproteobacteria bacterium]